MGSHRFERVGGTARVEPAPTHQQSPQGGPVGQDASHEEPPHRCGGQPDRSPDQPISPASANTRRISSMSSEAFESPKGPRATRIRSNPSSTPGPSARQASLSRRRARLRATAPPTCFPVTHAAREGPGGLGATYTTTRSDLYGFPSLRARRIAGVSIRRRVSLGPSCAGDRGWSAPRGCASWNGSHGSASVCECWAGRCASWSK